MNDMKMSKIFRGNAVAVKRRVTFWTDWESRIVQAKYSDIRSKREQQTAKIVSSITVAN